MSEHMRILILIHLLRRKEFFIQFVVQCVEESSANPSAGQHPM